MSIPHDVETYDLTIARSVPIPSPPSVAFVHIPKTAGRTLVEIIQRNYPRGTLYSFHGDNRRAVENFERLPEAERFKVRCLAGHMPLGMETSLRPPRVCITMLRDPVKRVVSIYDFIRRRPRHYLHQKVISNHMSLEAFAESDLTPEIDNCLTRRLSGDRRVDGIFGAGEVSREVLDLAIANLNDRFLVAGIQERFDESLLLMGRLLGWSHLNYVCRNVARRHQMVTPVSDSALRIIEERNNLDRVLFRKAVRRLDRQLAEAKIGPADVEAFRAENTSCNARFRLSDSMESLREWIEESVIWGPLIQTVLARWRPAEHADRSGRWGSRN